jgi:hypothetical protein
MPKRLLVIPAALTVTVLAASAGPVACVGTPIASKDAGPGTGGSASMASGTGGAGGTGGGSGSGGSGGSIFPLGGGMSA